MTVLAKLHKHVPKLINSLEVYATAGAARKDVRKAIPVPCFLLVMVKTKIILGHQQAQLPYFSAYKTDAFPFQNNPKNLDPSYKMDLDL